MKSGPTPAFVLARVCAAAAQAWLPVSGGSRVANAGATAARSRIEQSFDAGGGLLQLVRSGSVSGLRRTTGWVWNRSRASSRTGSCSCVA
jgi:hypothetical protein